MMVFLSRPKELLQHIDASEVPTIYSGSLEPDWQEWAEASKKAILDNHEIELHTFCSSYRGDMLQLMQQLHIAKREMGVGGATSLVGMLNPSATPKHTERTAGEETLTTKL